MSRQGDFRYQGDRSWNVVNDCERNYGSGGCGRRDEWNVIDDCRRGDDGRRRCDGGRDGRHCDDRRRGRRCDDRRDHRRCDGGYRRRSYGDCKDLDAGCSIS